MNFLEELVMDCDVACDVLSAYESYREEECVTKTISLIMDDFVCEREDYDDAPMFWIGLAYSMAEKHELNRKIMAKAMSWLTKAFENEKEIRGMPLMEEDLNNIQSYFESCIGRAKRASKANKYELNWKVGDIYLVPLQSEKAIRMGLDGYYGIVRVVDTVQFKPDSEVCPIIHAYLYKEKKKPKGIDDIVPCFIIPGNTVFAPNVYRFNVKKRGYQTQAFKAIEYFGNYPDFPPVKEFVLKQAIYNPFWYCGEIEAQILFELKRLREDEKFDYRLYCK